MVENNPYFFRTDIEGLETGFHDRFRGDGGKTRFTEFFFHKVQRIFVEKTGSVGVGGRMIIYF
jgi:hypothetical protein